MALTTIETNGIETRLMGNCRPFVSNIGIDRRSFSRIPTVWEMPDLVQVQIESFEWFKREGLRELLEEISPITDHHKKMELTLRRVPVRRTVEATAGGLAGAGKGSIRGSSSSSAASAISPTPRRLRIKAKLRVVNPETGEIREIGAGEDEDSEIFIGDFPLMTTDGTFIINGAERVVVSQLVRSPGVYFDRVSRSDDRQAGLVRQADPEPRRLAGVRDVESRRHVGQGRPQAKDAGDDPAAGHRHDRRGAARRRLPTSTPIRIGHILRTTLEKDPTHQKDEALIELYRRLRPGDPPTRDNATTMLENLFFNDRRYDLARVGRYKLNERLHREKSGAERGPIAGS